MPRKKSTVLNSNTEHIITPKAYLELDEIKRLEEAATNLRDQLLIRLLFHSGCRISEALGITTEDIDLVSRSVTIQHLKTRLNLLCPECGARLGRKHTFCPGCGAKVVEAVAEEKEHHRMRTLPIDEKTLLLLKEYISRDGPVFKNGKKFIFGINRHRAWQVVTGCAEIAGLPKLINTETGKVHNVSPHKLRDAFAVHAIKVNDSGDGLRLLQQYLGHQSFDTTARYRKVSGEEQKAWYEQLWQDDNP
jgi:integrase/recombinase XerD